MTLSIPVKTNLYYKAILLILNFKLNLSPMEIDIVACILNHDIKIVDIYTREIIRKELDKDKFNTNNYISRLRDKGILITKPLDKKLYVAPEIYELVKDRKLNFEFELIN